MIEEAEQDLEAVVAALLGILGRRGWHLGTAESLTGGMVGAVITAVPGASAVYVGGAISYTDYEKTALLGVPVDLLQRWGAVSAEVAEAMAKGCKELLRVDVAVATTGVAGPGADERATPVGTVFVACAVPGECRVERLKLAGDRREVRVAATHAVLELALRLVQEI